MKPSVIAAVVMIAVVVAALPSRAEEPPPRGAIAERALGGDGRVGVALFGLGAGAAAATAAATNLIEAASKSDNRLAPVKYPELVQIGGFATVTAMSLAAGAMLLGAALVADDLLDDTAPATPADPAALPDDDAR